jgi:hypothetical protein
MTKPPTRPAALAELDRKATGEEKHRLSYASARKKGEVAQKLLSRYSIPWLHSWFRAPPPRPPRKKPPA